MTNISQIIKFFSSYRRLIRHRPTLPGGNHIAFLVKIGLVAVVKIRVDNIPYHISGIFTFAEYYSESYLWILGGIVAHYGGGIVFSYRVHLSGTCFYSDLRGKVIEGPFAGIAGGPIAPGADLDHTLSYRFKGVGALVVYPMCNDGDGF